HKTITTVEAAWPKFKIAINLTEVKVEDWKRYFYRAISCFSWIPK
ncbi:hypothetical protein ACJ8HD_20245, partial [Serratia sp. CY39337]